MFEVLDGQNIEQTMRFITAGLLAVFTSLVISFLFVLVQVSKDKSTLEERRKDLIHEQFNLITFKATKTGEEIRSFSGGGFHGGGGHSGGGRRGGGGHHGF